MYWLRNFQCIWELGIRGERAVEQVVMNRRFCGETCIFKLHTVKKQDVINASGHIYYLLSVVSPGKVKPLALCGLVYCWKKKDRNHHDTWQELSSVQLVNLNLVCLDFCKKLFYNSSLFVVAQLVKEIQKNICLKMFELLLEVRKFSLYRAVFWSAAESIAGEVLLSLSCKSIERCENCRRVGSNILLEI